MATDDELTMLYANLRAQILSRHFALGRYFRRNLFSQANRLGVWKGSQGATLFDRKGCGNPGEKPVGADGTTPLYASVRELLEKERANPALGEAERWRIIYHWADNPLVMTGMRLIDLAVEAALGNADSLEIIRLTLATLESLYKFQGDHFDGYILRWDVATSDDWKVSIDPQTGEEHLTVPCDFLINLDPNSPIPYSYCTNFHDSRYVSDYPPPPPGTPGAGDSYVKRRRWEPSQDELIGLLAGFSTIFALVQDDDIRASVQSQVRRIGDYLAYHAYVMLRPDKGFVARGASDLLTAFEYPFGRVFKRITGDSFASRVSFVDALKKADVWSCVKPYMVAGQIIGVLSGLAVSIPLFLLGAAGAVLLPILIAQVSLAISSYLGGIATTVTVVAFVIFLLLFGGGLFSIAILIGYVLGGTIGLFKAADCFDVWDSDVQHGFALGYFLGWIPAKLRFQLWMLTPMSPGADGSGDLFRPFIGVTALDDTDTTVRDMYVRWYNLYGTRDPSPEVEGAKPGGDASDATKREFAATRRGATVFNSAVAALLSGGLDAQKRMVDQFQLQFDSLVERWNRNLVLTDTPDVVQECHDKNDDSSLAGLGGFQTSLALAWLLQHRQQASHPKMPAAPTNFTNWPRPKVPRAVVRAARQGNFPVPLSEIVRGFDATSLPDSDADLFVDPPPKPDDNDPRLKPPSPVTNSWKLKVTQDVPIGFCTVELKSGPFDPPPFDTAANPDFVLAYSRVSASGNANNLLLRDEARIEGGKLILHVKIYCHWLWESPASYEVEYRFGWVYNQF